jgi:hypothetical protein
VLVLAVLLLPAVAIILLQGLPGLGVIIRAAVRWLCQGWGRPLHIRLCSRQQQQQQLASIGSKGASAGLLPHQFGPSNTSSNTTIRLVVVVVVASTRWISLLHCCLQ